MAAVKRALISCHDKTGLAEFAKGLAGLGVEILASGGTAAHLTQHGLRVRTVEEFTGAGELLDGRVKTLHPKIHAGILARRDDPAHVRSVGQDNLIDLVAVNLYPFEDTVRQPSVTVGAALEQIDIGGVALLRAAAKNFPHVAVVCHPRQYAEVLAALTQGRGSLPEPVARHLAAAFDLTSRYDQLITDYLADQAPDAAAARGGLQAQLHQPLRYGENPHQQAGWYVPQGVAPAGLAKLVQRQGKPLTYNNLLDLDAAVRCLLDFPDPTCVIVKHASPCGIASASSLADAYRLAYDGDAESAFGGIVAVNRPLDAAAASQMSGVFLEIISAPAIPADALACFAKKPNLRLLELGDLAPARLAKPNVAAGVEWRSVLGGWIAQERDAMLLNPAELRVVTKRQPTEAERRDALFAWTAVKHVKSNAIVLAKDQATVGIGQGQPSRVRAVRLAIQNAGAKARGAVLASDAFFPFPDNVELAAQAGVTAIIQPGGSVKDPNAMAAADQAGLAMFFTGVRHFRH